MISAYEARRRAKDNSALEPILKSIEDEICKSSLHGKYETRIEIPTGNFNKICEILESFGYVCSPRRLDEQYILREISKIVCTVVSWKGDDEI